MWCRGRRACCRRLCANWREARYKVNIVSSSPRQPGGDGYHMRLRWHHCNPCVVLRCKTVVLVCSCSCSLTARCKLMTIKFAPYLNIRNAINYKIDTCERDKNIVLLVTNKFLQSLSDYSSFFREFLPETQHCWAQNLGIEYSGWTDLINGGNFFIAVCCSLLNNGKLRRYT